MIGFEGASSLKCRNPYQMGEEKIFYAYQFLIRDLDMIAALLPELVAADQPITKKTASAVFGKVVRDIYELIDREPDVSAERRSAVKRDLFRDVMKRTRSGEFALNELTAWHRISLIAS